MSDHAAPGQGRRALLIAAGQGRRGRDPAPFIAALEAGGIVVVQRECPPRDRLAELILSMRKEVDCVVLGLDDAMMSAGAIALRDTGLPLGILPLGPSDLAWRVGVPHDLAEAAAVIVAGQVRTLDLGSVNGQPFFGAASVGLPIATARQLRRATKSRFGRLGFMWAALNVLLRMSRFSCIIRCGGIVHRVRTLQVTIGNGRSYRGNMELPAPAADKATVGALSGPSDHLLDVYSLEPPTRWSLMFMQHIFETADPEVTDPEAPEFRVARSPVVEVVTRLPQSIMADGEEVTVTPARFSVLTDAIAVYAP